MTDGVRAQDEVVRAPGTNSFPATPVDVFRCLWRHRRLVFQLARRDVVGRYRGSYLGLLWSLFYPLLMLAVYTLVFGAFFRTRWGPSGSASMAEFALVLFTGLIVFGIFSDCINRAPSLVVSHATFVKRVVFPLEVLPWVAVASALFHAAASFAVLIAAIALVLHALPPTWPLFVVVLLPLVLLAVGLAWALSAIGVYVRDVAQAVGVVTSMLMFLSPVFYPAESVPEQMRWLLRLNPLTVPIEEARKVLLWGQAPDVAALATFTAVGLAVAWIGLVIFQRTRDGFADVL
jgi:lipopolysaccharide transport system permease protein